MSASVAEVLEDQHNRIGSLFGEVSLPDADRPAVLHQLLRELAAHVAAERSVVHPLVKERGVGDPELSEKLLGDYEQLEKLMVLIERRKFNSPDLPDLVGRLKDVAGEHASRCESQLYPGLEAVLSPEEEDKLCEQVSNADSMVVSHPHPHLLSLGPIAGRLTAMLARFDRLRDKTVTSQPPPPPEESGLGPGGTGREDPSAGGAT